MKEKYNKYEVMDWIRKGISNNKILEENKGTTLTQGALSLMRSEYANYIRDKAQSKQLVSITGRMLRRIEDFDEKYKMRKVEMNY